MQPISSSSKRGEQQTMLKARHPVPHGATVAASSNIALVSGGPSASFLESRKVGDVPTESEDSRWRDGPQSGCDRPAHSLQLQARSGSVSVCGIHDVVSSGVRFSFAHCVSDYVFGGAG